MKKNKIEHYSDKEALEFHSSKKSGKIEIISSKPMITKRDLALAYSPGVAAPVKAIAKNPELAYDYTTKGNLVAVISNGSAILGLGNLGAIAAKPVMEGKAVLFKRFADIDAIDLGSGPLADAFFVAFRIPNTFRRLFSEGAFNAAFVPSYSSELIKDKRKINA